MNDGELNGLVLAAACVIFYYACHFIMWLWQGEQRRMDEFSSQMDALETRTNEAGKLAVTMDRPDGQWTQEEINRTKSRQDINRLCAEIEGK